MKRLMAATASAAIAMTGTALMATPAEAAPVVTGGLVNVNVSDIEILEGGIQITDNEVLSRNNVGVGVAAGIAANVCNIPVSAAVLGVVRDVENDGFSCTSAAGDQMVEIPQQQ